VAWLASVAAFSAGMWALETTSRASGSAARSRGDAPTIASNRRAAVHDAEQLRAGVVPPAGAVVQSSGTSIGAHGRLITAAPASAIAYRTWNVRGDPATVLTFVQSHLPPGSTIFSTGSGGLPFTQSVVRSWPPVHGVLDDRLLDLEVSARADGGTRLYADAQSQWVIARPKGEHIPAGVREVDVTDGWPSHEPFLSRRVRSRATVSKLVKLFNSLELVQPVGINCPAESVTPIVTIVFRAGARARPVAQAKVSSAANFSWPASVPGWACFPISFDVGARSWTPLAGNVITPIHSLLHVRLGRPTRGG
jgi:hypothetical protein